MHNFIALEKPPGMKFFEIEMWQRRSKSKSRKEDRPTKPDI